MPRSGSPFGGYSEGGAPRGAVLVLEDGRVFHGTPYGAEGETFGEMVFNTGMTGYQETLTDPSYHRQIVAMTAPHIGNTGVNDDDPESSRVWVAGYVVREPSRVVSSWRATRSLDAYLKEQGVVGIAISGTRALTRHLRERGAMRAGIFAGPSEPVEELVERVRRSPGMEGADLAAQVATAEPYVVPAAGTKKFTVAAVDLGIKGMTPHRMAERGCEVHVLPATATYEQIMAVKPDGVFFSNGPGDPATADVSALRQVLEARVPFFGICFGNQLFGRALGLSTYKLRYGHRGVNQPVQDVRTGKVEISAHNHGFAVEAPLDGPFETPYGPAEVTHVNLNDRCVEGLRLLEQPAFSVQYHPEAAAGPHDAAYLFDEFCEILASSCARDSGKDGKDSHPCG
ncbi:glutamine-hydrolyzing carbamoyl-phosphate synthase small subunit [Nonomuraea sp. B1E8]|uniref:glutamine-hydrolyzing carbamoyl-phosphate synthase small subunit n=1 Tax=unclassified Nonomuraea TaxID=2593643 RepID=UPI00325F3F9D